MMKDLRNSWEMKTKNELDEIYSYEKQALDSIPKDHPNYNEIRALLIDQIKDQIDDVTHSKPN